MKDTKDVYYGLEQSDLDYLTGCANRRGLYKFYAGLPETEIIHAMYVDIDNFKRINDIYGHSMGDSLLVCVSRHIKEVTQGFVVRVGGDEFVVLNRGKTHSEQEIKTLAEKLINTLEDLDFRPDVLSLISLSVGIVLSQYARQNLDEILIHCDAALYQSKYNGKRKVTIYDSDDKNFEISRNYESEMEDSLARGDFKVYLQPKVNMITSEIVGAEAVSRWEVNGEVRPPSVYLPLFEKNGFVSKLDLYMFSEVCRMKAGWKGKTYEDLVISVNLSRLHLYNKKLPSILLEICEGYGVSPKELELEITETIFMKDTQELISMTKRLQACGFQVSIDDFGSGYSALNLLKDIEVDTIKIDKEFLAQSTNTTRGRQVVRSVIAMCRDLKINVVTEGVESEEQVEFLTRCSCQIAQGFYYSPPLSEPEFDVFATKYKRDILDVYYFPLESENLSSGDGQIAARYSGETLTFSDSVFKGKKAVHFPGGKVEENVIEISPDAIRNDSYTISFWLKPDVVTNWTSAIYVKFETGFASFSPLAWDGHSDFRIRDSREVNGWYDTSSCVLEENHWWHVAMAYNANTERAYLYINGETLGILEKVPCNRFVKRIMVGGDVFQRSFEGTLCELKIFNVAKDFDYIKNMYQEYLSRPDFEAGELKSLI